MDPPTVPIEEDDLSEFRAQWKSELQSKGGKAPPGSDSTPSVRTALASLTLNANPPDTKAANAAGKQHKQIVRSAEAQHRQDGKENATAAAVVTTSDKSSAQSSSAPKAPLVGRQTTADSLEMYEEAVNHERNGRLADALRLYRRAVKLDPNVELLYRQRLLAQAPAAREVHTASHHEQRQGQAQHSASEQRRAMPPGDQAPLVIDVENAMLMPLAEDQPFRIGMLPDDVLVHVLQQLLRQDVGNLPSIACVCKKLCALTRNQSVWRYLCATTYKPAVLAKYQGTFSGGWRSFFIKVPRLRLDGVYISRHMYIRPGISDTSYYAPIHLIEYYRYLRFLPNGEVISWLTTAEPREVVKMFSPDALTRTKDMKSGQYELNDGDVSVVLKDPRRPRERFIMRLSLHSTAPGRHNKLAWLQYVMETQTRRDVDVVELDLTNFKPFYCSRVRSYVQ
ncbi:hypothetical protein RI367_000089 [Sorochytrium milnesiophthora]